MNKQPPYVVDLIGDPTFSGADLSNQAREVILYSVERERQPWTPKPFLNLSYLRVEQVAVSEAPLSPGLIQRKWTYRIVPQGDLPAGTTTGSLIVRDPTYPDDIYRLSVAVVNDLGLKAVPETIEFGENSGNEVELLVIADEPLDTLDGQVEGKDSFQIRLKSDPCAAGAVVHRFLVSRVDPTRRDRLEARIRIGRSARPDAACLVIPVRFPDQE